MLLVTIDVLKNVLTPDQKELLIEKITTALVEVEGENIRPVAWVRINELRAVTGLSAGSACRRTTYLRRPGAIAPGLSKLAQEDEINYQPSITTGFFAMFVCASFPTLASELKIQCAAGRP